MNKQLSDKELLEKIMADTDFEKNAAEEISAQIDEELSKKTPDYNKIKELSEQYSFLVGADDEIEERADEHIAKIMSAARASKPKHKKRFKSFMAVSAAAVMVFTANCISVAAFDMNIFKAIVQYTKGGFSVDFSKEPVENSDPYGIRAECEKYGIYPEVPSYLPDGFELTSSEYVDLGICKSVCFYFHHEDEEITMFYDLYNNIEDVSNTVFPSDYYNIEEIQINGKPAVTSKEDNQYTLVYANDRLILTIFSQNVPYDECDKISNSIK